VVAPTTDLGLLVLGIIAVPLGGWAVTLAAISIILGFSLVRVGRMMRNLGRVTLREFGQALTVASIYDIARALAPICGATHQLRRRSERSFRRPVRVLELRSVFGTGGGPEKTILQGAAITDPDRIRVTVCYIRDRRDEVFGIDARAARLGVDYVEVYEKHSFDPGIWPELRRLVRERKIDIVHAHDYKTNVLALMLGGAEGAIPLTTVHGWTGHTWKEKGVYYPIDKRVISRFPRAIAVSEEIRQELLRCGATPERITTVLNGIDHRAFQRDLKRIEPMRRALGIAADDLVIGGVGRLEPQKRFDVLIEAFALARKTRPALRLLIVGDGGERQSLQALVARLGLGDVCQLLGHRQDITDLHHAFDAFVQSSDYEGTPNAVLEAMALETPIVATDVGGTSELIEDGVHGVVIRPSDPEALAEAIDWVFENPKAARRRAAAARMRVEGPLSFDTRMRTVIELYESLAGEATPAPAGQSVTVQPAV
jgi:glycosyltransferase involved in cell wall biosynthesis